MKSNRQRGLALIMSLVFLLMLTLLATSSMQNATLQEKVAGSLRWRDQSFQRAESVLRAGEARVLSAGFELAQCPAPVTCLPPPEALTLSAAGAGGHSGVIWTASEGGFYGVQFLGQTDNPAGPRGLSDKKPRPLYRITAVGVQGNSRTVLESIHTQERRVMWRQRQ